MFKLISSTFILFLCSFTDLYGKYYLTICTIFQNEAPYLKEWIEFHKLQGVQHFYLYNNNSEDNFVEVLAPYIKQNEVTLEQWPFTYQDRDAEGWRTIQTGAYTDCLAKYGDQTLWLAVIDADEFLFCPTGKKIPHFLKKFAEYGGVCANWLNFGTSHLEELPPNKTMIESLTYCADLVERENLRFKSIVQPKHIKACHNEHYFEYQPGKFHVDAKAKKLPEKTTCTSRLLLDELRINHYWTRTEKYMREYKMENRKKRNARVTDRALLRRAESYNKSRDFAIQPFVPLLRKTMGYINLP